MKTIFYSSKNWVKQSFEKANIKFGLDLTFLETKLNPHTAKLAQGYDIVCVFVNDIVDASVLEQFNISGIKLLALRCAGYNNVDVKSATAKKIPIVRVPAYSPYAVAEHALGLILTLNRKLHRAYNRVRDGNFALEGLLGFDLNGKTVGVIGTGKIGLIFCKIMKGLNCKVIAYDKFKNPEAVSLGLEYVELSELYARSDIISLHCPLNYETFHMINEYAILAMKPGVMIINTSRGPLIDTNAIIAGLKSEKVAYLGLDVYEEEQDLFFEDLTGQVIQDDTFVRLLTFPGVLITGHQAFFTQEAIDNIADTTLSNIDEFIKTGTSTNLVHN